MIGTEGYDDEMLRHLVLTTCWAAAGSLALATVASAASDDQGRADAAIAAFDDEVQGAGYTSSGPGDEGDVLELGGDATDGFGTAAGECLGDLSATIADDGSFVGETARATADTYALEPVDSSDDVGFAMDEHTLDAVVAFIDDAHVADVNHIVDQFGSSEVGDCLSDLFTEQLVGESAEIGITNDDLGVGDASAQFTIALTSAVQDQDIALVSAVSVALVDRAFVIVRATDIGPADASPSTNEIATDALGAMVDALGG